MPPMDEYAEIPARFNSPLSYADHLQANGIIKTVSDAVIESRVLLSYQPVVTADPKPRIGFYEGLIRILDSTGRIIPARDFIHEVEAMETGREIDRLALRLGLKTLSENPGLRLSVNMSARSIGYRPWYAELERWLAISPYLGERLILEISERSVMQVPELVTGFMKEMRQKDICFAIDGFASGFISLKFLKQMDFDILKIDGQHVQNVAENADNQVLISAIQAMAGEFGMYTVAQNVEAAADAAALVRLGVNFMQGFHYGAPVTRPPWEITAQERA